MNCAECRDNLVALTEGLLERDEALQCHAHLESCTACAAEYSDIANLQQRLVTRGQMAADIAIVQPVMQRVLQKKQKKEETLMSKLFKYRWGFGLGAAGAAAILVAALLFFPRVQATAAEVMVRGARAVARLSSIHLRGQLRTLPADNFGYINQHCDFVPIELWKQLEPELKWRVDKPGRTALMDGQSTVLYISAAKIGNKFSGKSESAFDTAWLHGIANLSQTLSNELTRAVAKGWKLELTEEIGADGKQKSVVTVHASSGLPDTEYLKNTFFDFADTRRVFRFDAQTELLESVQVYLVQPAGEVLIFDLSNIDYNQPISTSVWQLDLAADVQWVHEVQKLPDNDKYAAMTAEDAARAFFEACGREDWGEAEKFMSPLTDGLKQYMGHVEIVSLGQSFSSQAYGGGTNLQRFVPYEIKLRPQEMTVRLSNTNAAHRYVLTGICDTNLQPVEEFKWANEPQILSDNDAYARMSPAETFKALVAASEKLDWPEIEKFMPTAAVERLKSQVSEAQKAGIDIRNIMPKFEIGEEFQAPNQSSWFVKVRMSQIKKWNLALRKDNPAGRWQVDGGI